MLQFVVIHPQQLMHPGNMVAGLLYTPARMRKVEHHFTTQQPAVCIKPPEDSATIPMVMGAHIVLLQYTVDSLVAQQAMQVAHQVIIAIGMQRFIEGTQRHL